MVEIYCKQCGGLLPHIEGARTVVCEYCGSLQTLPTTRSDQFIERFSQANELWRRNQFDSAATLYTKLAVDFPYEAEVYWRLVLCKYGIEYVDDPKTGKKIPTCHRASLGVLSDNPDYQKVLQLAEPEALEVYREEAARIDALLKRYQEIISRETPFDVFICYKEKQADGDRTPDSVLAQDIYDALTERGYKVFFSRVSLKPGTVWEAQIFAALNTAKVMLAVGTRPEHFNAVWVKNEWSRYLEIVAQSRGASPKKLIPCYRDMDPYDMPREFRGLQGLNMGSIGAIPDLIRNVEAVIPPKAAKKQEAVAGPAKATLETLMESGNMALEDLAFSRAERTFRKACGLAPASLDAYIGLLLAEHGAKDRKALAEGMAAGMIDPTGDTLSTLKRLAREQGNADVASWCENLEKQHRKNLKAKADAEREAERQQELKERKDQRQRFAKSPECKKIMERIARDSSQSTGSFRPIGKLVEEMKSVSLDKSDTAPAYGSAALVTVVALTLLIFGWSELTGFEITGALETLLRIGVVGCVILAGIVGIMAGGLVGGGVGVVVVYVLSHLVSSVSGWFGVVPGAPLLLWALYMLFKSLKNRKAHAKYKARLKELEEEVPAKLRAQIEEELKAGYLKQFNNEDPDFADFDYQPIAKQLYDKAAKELGL